MSTHWEADEYSQAHAEEPEAAAARPQKRRGVRSAETQRRQHAAWRLRKLTHVRQYQAAWLAEKRLRLRCR